jgi:DNA-binding winged helix-turn-helix (wHTH) protein/TolB-like protein/Flp pilus assembly protein TadD
MRKQLKHFYEFGPFRLEPGERQLLCRDKPVPLTAKAFDMLLVLVENSGHLVDKEVLLKKVWPESFVEEANLSHHIYKLREVLGHRDEEGKYIETVPRRGYRFIAEVIEIHDKPGEEILLAEHSRARITMEESEQQEVLRASEAMLRQGPVLLDVSARTTDKRRRNELLRLIVLPVSILIVIAAGYFFWTRHNVTKAISTPGPIRSLAVLPFRPLSAESRDESLELGMADALITKLSNVKQVVVRPTSAILKYEDAAQDLLAAGREQGVDAVIEGKVQRLGDEVKLTVQLVRVSDGTSLWAGTFNDKFTSIFAMQDSISAQVAASLVPQLTGDEQKRLAKHYTDNIEAYQLYLEGRVYWWKFSPEGAEKSISYYNKAIALDPSYALAYAGLSFSYSVQGAIGAVAPIEAYQKSKIAAETAVRLDGDLAEAHVALGGKSLFFERDWPNARKEFERAIELNPNQPDAHELLGYYWEVFQQYDKAAAELKNAQRITPLMGLVNMDVAALAYYQHHYDEAVALYWKAHNLDPDFLPFPFMLGQAYERKGDYERAINECQKALSSAPDDQNTLSLLGYAYARAGRRNEAQVILDKLVTRRKQHFVSPFMIALLCTALDKKDEAIDWLNKAVDERDPQLIWVGIEPQLDPLHTDQRFKQLLQKLGIP